MSLRDGRHGGRFYRIQRPAGGRGGGRGVEVRILILQRALDTGWPARSAWGAWGPWSRGRKARGGGRGQDARVAVAGRSTVRQERSVGLRSVSLVVVLVHSTTHTGDVTAKRDTKSPILHILLRKI